MKAARTDRLALFAVAALLAALQLWLRPLLPVDETRYLSVAWEMWQRGDYLVPYLNGEPYSHKPPLLFWLVLGLWKLFGVSEWPARLLPVALSLFGLWVTRRLAGVLWPGEAALAAQATWLLFGSLFWMNFFSLVQFDLLVLLAVLVAWLGVWQAREAPRTGWAVVALAFGLGVLAKGPVALVFILPVLLLAPWWLPQAPRGGWWGWYAGAALALLAGAGIALLWAVPAGQAGGAVYREAIFWGQSAGRLVASFAHRAPWWSYLFWLPLMWLPWLLWPAVWRGLRRLSTADAGVRFCLAAFLPALLLFSLISGKQPKYLLPLLPLLALLTARGLTLAPWPGGCFRPWPAAVGLGVLGLGLFLLPRWSFWDGGAPLAWAAVSLVLAFVFARVCVAYRTAVRAIALGGVLGTAVLYATVVEPLAPNYRLQPLATHLGDLQRQGRPVAWLGKYHGQFQFLGRLRAPITALTRPGQLRAWVVAHPEGLVLVGYPGRQPVVPQGLRVQRYRGGSLVLWPAKTLLEAHQWLDALAGNA